MNQSKPSSGQPLRRQMLAAMVVGTALSALTAVAEAQAQSPQTAARAIQDMSRYCSVCWRNARLHPDCWTDCTQEVFVRLLERVGPDDWGRALRDDGPPRCEFLRAIDTVKKRAQRARKTNGGLVDLLADHRDRHELRVADERESVRQAAAQLLSERQQRILQLSFEGWSVHELAQTLDLPAERVSDEKYKAIRKLRDHLLAAERA